MTSHSAPPPGRMRLWAMRHRAGLYSLCVWLLAGVFTLAGMSVEWVPTPAVGMPNSVAIVTIALLGALHAVRNRWPVITLLLSLSAIVGEAVLTGQNSTGSIILVGDLVYSVVLASRASWVRRLSMISAASAIGALLIVVLWGAALPGPLAGALMLVVIQGFTLWWAESVRSSRIMAEQETARADAIRRAGEAETRQALAESRTATSRDLHDTVSGQLSGIAMRAEAALADPTLGEQARVHVTAIREGSVAALAEMRTLIDVLRGGAGPGTRESADTLDRWPRLTEAARRVGATIDVSALDPDDLAGMTRPASVAGFRVVQEGLANAATHAPGEPVRLTIERTPTGVRVSLENDLTPVPLAGRIAAAATDSRPSGDRLGDQAVAESYSLGVGLVGLDERLRLVGGSLHAGATRRDDGRSVWRLCATLPNTIPTSRSDTVT